LRAARCWRRPAFGGAVARSAVSSRVRRCRRALGGVAASGWGVCVDCVGGAYRRLGELSLRRDGARCCCGCAAGAWPGTGAPSAAASHGARELRLHRDGALPARQRWSSTVGGGDFVIAPPL
jgi:hypothetical protein